MPCETIVAIEGHALKMDVENLDTELRNNPEFQSTLTQYSHALLVASMRTTGCTGLHNVSQRCARWMLQTLDRVSSDRFAVTHEFLATLMGTRRATVSEVIEEFQRAGCVNTTRGNVTVTDRDRLETLSCECYRIIREHYEEVGRY
jgi:CRP-like cAMP-binding protein